MQEIFIAIIGFAILLASMVGGILWVPFNLYLDINKEGQKFNGMYRLAWLGITLKSDDIFAPTEMDIPGKKRDEELIRHDSSGDSKSVYKRNIPDPKTLMEALPPAVRIFKDIVRSLHIDVLSCRVVLGLQDPVDTAVTCGYLWSLISALKLHKENIFIEPRFDKELLDGLLLVEIRTKLIWIFLAIFQAIKDEKLRKLIRNIARG
ncbi:MAG: DUF2953 domain-containing protein [Methanotrichaceae archaeon]|nr:DUF2953 domain-containing protein [Methanotrichaceae archaeon]